MRGRALAVAAGGVSLALAAAGCVQPECARPDYRRAECRVLAENELARLQTSTDVEVRFQTPGAVAADSWDATGVLEELDPGRVRARVATPGPFAISFERGTAAPPRLQLRLENVPGDLELVFEGDGPAVTLPPPEQPGSVREVQLDLPAGSVAWLRGEPACPPRFRVVALGDIQTNPPQFERIVERLGQEAQAGRDEGEPLLAVLILGDVTELSTDSEFDLGSKLIARLPAPAAVAPGNHDIFLSSRAIFNRTFGPGNFTFDLCDAHFVMLDTGNGSLARSIEGRLPELFDGGDARFTVVGTHYPAYPGQTGNGWAREDQAQHLLAEAAWNRVDLLLAGHVHALFDFPGIDVGGKALREIVAGTAGANQGLGIARYGYVRMTFGDELETCFVEVPPAGAGGPLSEPVSAGLPYCGP